MTRDDARLRELSSSEEDGIPKSDVRRLRGIRKSNRKSVHRVLSEFRSSSLDPVPEGAVEGPMPMEVDQISVPDYEDDTSIPIEPPA